MNRVRATQDARGAFTTFTYDLAGNRIEVQDALNYRTTIAYTPLNQTRSITDALSQITTYSYDAAVRPVSMQNARGHLTTMIYDPASRVLATRNALNYRTTYSYDAAGKQTATLNARGYLTTYQYDAAGNPKTMQDSVGAVTTYGYDALNRLKNVQNAMGQVATTSYNSDGQVSSLENPLGYRTTFIYDALHRRTAVWDAEGRRTTTVFDNSNQVIAEQNALNFRTTFQYDVAGRREALINANNARTTYQYDPVGNVTLELEPLGRLTTFTYTALNQLQSRHDARGVLTTYLYDAVGRVTGRRFTGATPTVTYVYDAVGNRTEMSDASGVTTYTYDAVDRQLTRFNSVDTTRLTQSYDPVGNRLTLDVNEGRFTYVYNSVNLATQITTPFGDRATIAYDALSRSKQIDVGGGLRRTYTYDAAGRTKSVFNGQLPSTDFSQFDYEYDRVGNPLSVANLVTTNVTTYAYDPTYRLVNERASGTVAYNFTHIYDPVGNRLFEDSGVQRTTFTYDAANQLIRAVFPPTYSYPTHDYTYDGAGNLIIDYPLTSSSNAKYYTWNAENQLIKAESDRQDTYNYQYNGDGLRTSKADDGGTPLRFVWDGQNLLREAQGSVVYLNTYNPQALGKLLGRRRSTTPNHWFGYDALGTVTNIINGTGTTLLAPRFSAYGKLISNGGYVPPAWIGEVGYFRDDNDDYLNYYVRARWYNPATARWMSRDPLGYEGSQWNLHEYVRSNPVVFVDPSGLVKCPGGSWTWVGTTRGGQVGVGYYLIYANFYCDKSILTSVRIYECEGFSIEQKIYKVPVARGAMRAFPLGLGLGGTLYRHAAGKITGKPDSSGLAGWDWTYLNLSVEALVGGFNFGGGSCNREVEAGLAIGVGASLSTIWSYTSIYSDGYEIYEEPIRCDQAAILDCCTVRVKKLTDEVVDTPPGVIQLP